MSRIILLIKAIDKELIETNKNYLTLGQANKMLYEKGHITEFEKQNGFLKKLLENKEIKNSEQTESAPKQWRIFLSDKRLKRKKIIPKKKEPKETHFYENQVYEQKQVFSEQNNISWKWIVGGIIALIFVFSQFSGNDNNSVDSDPILAYNYAKDFIKDRLKSPSTAEFPGTFEKKNHVTDLGNGVYQINSWVDSQNGFGAMIRSRWSCRISFIGGKVQAENISIE
jgi:hypothetical protein